MDDLRDLGALLLRSGYRDSGEAERVRGNCMQESRP